MAGMGTGVFWGIPFYVPQALHGNYSSLDIAFGRFFFFGLFSLFFIKRAWKLWQSLAHSGRWMILLLSALGFWLYSIVLFFGIQEAGGVFGSLILGILPISIPLCSFVPKKNKWLLALGLSLLGVGVLNLFAQSYFSGAVFMPSKLGIGMLLVGLAMWTLYANLNTWFLQKNPQLSRKDLVSVMGIVSLCCMLPLFWINLSMNTTWFDFTHRPQFGLFVFLSTLLGLGSSWLANWLWNLCSSWCPPTISGPLIISETVFGLLYSFF